MKIHGEVKRIDIIDILCDCCGKSCRQRMDYECANFCAQWGYDSNKDEVNWDFYFCEECSDKIFKFIEDLKNGL